MCVLFDKLLFREEAQNKVDTAEPDTVMNNVIGFIMVDKTHTFKDISVVNSLPSQLVVALHVSTKEVNPVDKNYTTTYTAPNTIWLRPVPQNIRFAENR